LQEGQPPWGSKPKRPTITESRFLRTGSQIYGRKTGEREKNGIELSGLTPACTPEERKKGQLWVPKEGDRGRGGGSCSDWALGGVSAVF